MYTVLIKHLTNLGQMWPKYLPLATVADNTYIAPNLASYNPYAYELVFSRKPKLLLDFGTTPDIKVSGMFKIIILCYIKGFNIYKSYSRI